MISHSGRVNLELFKQVKVIRKEMEEGKEVDKEGEITVRFDFSIPMGVSYELAKEVVGELAAEVEKMEEANKKQMEEREKEANNEVGDKVEA